MAVPHAPQIAKPGLADSFDDEVGMYHSLVEGILLERDSPILVACSVHSAHQSVA